MSTMVITGVEGAEDYRFLWLHQTGQLYFQRLPWADEPRQLLAQGVQSREISIILAACFSKGLQEAARARSCSWAPTLPPDPETRSEATPVEPGGAS